MGTWAAGNFDNDGALDYVGEVMDGLVARIEGVFAEEGAADLDEYGEAVIMPSVHIISLLHEHCHAAPPKPAVVAGWKSRYLAIFDEQIDDLEPAGDFASERRAVIENTFTKLETQARTFWREG